MRLQFGLEDGEAFEDARDWLLEGFRQWADRRDLEIPEEGPWEALGFKFSYLDGHLGRWRRADLAEILTDLYPRKVIIQRGLDRVVPGLHALVDYLHDEGHLDPRSDPLDALHAALDDLEEPFRAAMADRSRYGPAKATFSAMLADGVDIGDRDAVQRWLDDLNAGAAAELLPGEEELAKAAAATTLMRWLRGFVEFIGDGLRLTITGKLRAADGKALVERLGADDIADFEYAGVVDRTCTQLRQVHTVVDLALGMGLVERSGRRLVPTAQAQRLAEAPLPHWRDALLQLLDHIGVLASRYGHGPRPFWVELIDNGMLDLLEAIHGSGDIPIPVLVETVWEDIEDCLEPPQDEHLDGTRDWVSLDIDWVVDTLANAGVVARRGGAWEADAFDQNRWVGGYVRLTPLGRWLLQQGIDDPEVGEFAEADLATMLAAVSDYDEEYATQEVAAWLDTRGAHAADEVFDGLHGIDDVTMRMMSHMVLSQLGDDAEPVVRKLADDPAYRPYARMWLIDRGFEQPAALDVEDAPTVFVENLLVWLEIEGPEGMVAAMRGTAPSDQALLDLIDALWRVPGAQTVKVLEAVASSRDRTLAKAARKALFKQRTAGSG